MNDALPPGWAETSFGAITCNHDARRVPLKASDRAARQGKYRYFGAQGVIDYIDAYLFEGTYLLIAEDGANLASRTQPIAQVATGQFWVNNHAHVIEPVSGISLAFLKHFINGNPLHGAVRGTAQPKLTQADLNAISIPVPPTAEQERIVAAMEEQFSRLDAGVAALECVRQNLKRMRSMTFALIADSTQDWRTLGDIAEVVGGVTKDAKRQSDPSFVEVPYLRVANVQRGYLDLSSITTIRVPATTADKLRLEPGDILFNEGGDRDKLGRGWIWEGQIKDCIHQNHVFRARLLTDEFEPRFVSMHGNTFGRIWFEKMGRQTTNLASLNLTTLKSFPVPNVPVERQREIIAEVESRLSVLDSLQSVIDQSLMRSNSLRSSILGFAFVGQLVPQDPADEPASVLLERIATERASYGHRSSSGRRPRMLREEASA